MTAYEFLLRLLRGEAADIAETDSRRISVWEGASYVTTPDGRRFLVNIKQVR